MTSNEMALMANIAVDMQKNEVNEVLYKIRDDIEDLTYYCCEVHPRSVIDDVLQIIDKYTNGGMSPEVKEHYEQLAKHYNKKGKKG